MVGGFWTFGSAAQGLILNNYATGDPLALLARVGIGVSMVFSYPLVFTGLRDGVPPARSREAEIVSRSARSVQSSSSISAAGARSSSY